MGILSSEIVEYLNQSGPDEGQDRLEKNPLVGTFINCSLINIRPDAVPKARQVAVFDGPAGRQVHINYHDGSHCHILQIAGEDVTVEMLQSLIVDIEAVGGNCQVQANFLIIFVPAGYYLSMPGHTSRRIILARDIDCVKRS